MLSFTPLAVPFLREGELRPFVTLVKNLFQQRRKTIHNTLRAFYSLPEETLERIAAEAGTDLAKRPETLTPDQFLALARGVVAASA